MIQTPLRKILSPSVMLADFRNLHKEITQLDMAGADVFHVDIMDGEFVPNFGLSWHDFNTIRSITNKPIDVHLMVKRPDVYLPYAFKNKADIIYVHYESGNAEDNLKTIKNNGSQAGLAVNPNTHFEDFASLLPLVDRLLVMRVHPGFAGRPPVPEVDYKVKQLLALKNRNFKIALDGAVCEAVISKWSLKGVDEFVLGTACGLFGAKRNGRSYAESIKKLRSCTQGIVDVRREICKHNIDNTLLGL